MFYAHSGKKENHEDWQLLAEHNNAVGSMAARRASWFGAQEFAEWIGKLHDIGKYSAEYQQRLHGGIRVDHATAGAKIVMEEWGKGIPLAKIMAYCIAGHHTGLANGIEEGQNRSTLKDRLSFQFGKDIPVLDSLWTKEFPLPKSISLPAIRPAKNKAFHGFQLAFLTRMLYSCLVDADFLDTEAFYHKLNGDVSMRSQYPDLSVLKTALEFFLSELEKKARRKNSGQLNDVRSHILSSCRKKAIELEPGLFTLTVPTGGGKTLTSMAFALDHACHHNLRRIIYVIPFTSIIEQNAQVFRQAFGKWGRDAVLEHHCAFDDHKFREQDTRDKLRLAKENWDYPVIVTTAVQFFESLFADRSSCCRKLHNIAGSVIILDEAQVLPLALLRPVMAAIDELARNYQCSIVLCTATQPALLEEKGFYNGFVNVRELAPEPQQLFQVLKRVTLKHIGLQTDNQLSHSLRTKEQVLMIVNNRLHARALYNEIKELEGTYILTTLLCARHRSEVLERIRADLDAGRPCRVISTSLIEAGVDVDFPCVMRAESGLDSVAQAAGRCNREGIHDVEQSLVLIFQAEEKWKNPPELSVLAATMREVVRNHKEDLLSPQSIEQYFSLVYWQKGPELDRKKILEMHSAGTQSLDFPFQLIAQHFQMIESHLVPLIVPYNNEAQALIDSLCYAEKAGGIARALQPYLVQIPQKVLQDLYTHKRVEILNPKCFGQQFWALIGCDLYDSDAGLSWDDLSFLKSENLII